MRSSCTGGRATRAIAPPADWDAIGEIAAAVPVPVVGNGDVLFPQDIDAAHGAQRAAPA